MLGETGLQQRQFLVSAAPGTVFLFFFGEREDGPSSTESRSTRAAKPCPATQMTDALKPNTDVFFFHFFFRF